MIPGTMERYGKLARQGASLFVLGLSSALGLELPPEAFANLGSQHFREREKAQEQLLDWGRERREPAMTELLRQSREAGDPEVRERCMGILRDLVEDEYSKEGKGYIGVNLEDAVVNLPGEQVAKRVIRITRVFPDTPAVQAGIRVNDLIVGMAGANWKENESYPLFQKRIQAMKPNTRVELRILRGDGLINLTVNLGRLPAYADPQSLNGQNVDPEAAERASKEAYFRSWLSRRKPQK